MIYKLEKWKIGERIRKERIGIGLSQEDFAVAVGLGTDSRTSVIKWENGHYLPSFKVLIKMCEIFDCEIGYLLCEEGYIGKTRKKTDFQKATGLSERAVEKLFTFRKRTRGSDSFSNFNFYINDIIEHDNFVELLEAIKKHVWAFNHPDHYNIVDTSSEAVKALVDIFNCEPHELKGNIKMSSVALIESILIKIVADIRLREHGGDNSPKKTEKKNGQH